VLQLKSTDKGVASALACIRLEELAKAFLLVELRAQGGHTDKQFWKTFRSHDGKWRSHFKTRFEKLLRTSLFKEGENEDEKKAQKEAKKDFEKLIKWWATLKNQGLYVDYYPKLGFATPRTAMVSAHYVPFLLKMGDGLQLKLKSTAPAVVS
jgi:AbiV family abortive infection protein